MRIVPEFFPQAAAGGAWDAPSPNVKIASGVVHGAVCLSLPLSALYGRVCVRNGGMCIRGAPAVFSLRFSRYSCQAHDSCPGYARQAAAHGARFYGALRFPSGEKEQRLYRHEARAPVFERVGAVFVAGFKPRVSGVYGV